MTVLSHLHTDLFGKRFTLQDFKSEAERGNFGGRISVYEEPRPDRVYTAGFDSAMGIEGRDSTTMCGMDKTCQREGEGRARQVFECAGAWGPEISHKIVYGMVSWFSGSFLMAESQAGGLAMLRILYTDRPLGYGYKFVWYDKPMGTAVPVMTQNPKLGWNTMANDLTMTRLIEWVRDRKVDLRSVQLIEQMGRLRWKPRSKTAEKDERVGDDALVMKLDGGGSPDLVVAARLAVYALDEVQHFEKPKPAFAPGTYGALFKLDERMPKLFPATGGHTKARFVPGSR